MTVNSDDNIARDTRPLYAIGIGHLFAVMLSTYIRLSHLVSA